MGVLDRLRRWLANLLDRDGTAESREEPEHEEPELDPDNVTEARVDGTDDPVQKLQELQQRDDERDGERPK